MELDDLGAQYSVLSSHLITADTQVWRGSRYLWVHTGPVVGYHSMGLGFMGRTHGQATNRMIGESLKAMHVATRLGPMDK